MTNSHKKTFASILPAADPDWLDLHQEEILDPDLPIVDGHHHLWELPRVPRYLHEELASDLTSGHNVIATVYIECTEAYREGGPEWEKPLGETEFVAQFVLERLCRTNFPSAGLPLTPDGFSLWPRYAVCQEL